MEHQYMTGMLFRHFASLEDIAYDINVWDMILKHDILEVVTSDLPYPVKHFNEKTEQAWEVIEKEVVPKYVSLSRYTDESIAIVLNSQQMKLFKAMDLLDLWIFCKEEQALGNNTSEIKIVIRNCEDMLIGKFGTVDKFMEDYEC